MDTFDRTLGLYNDDTVELSPTSEPSAVDRLAALTDPELRAAHKKREVKREVMRKMTEMLLGTMTLESSFKRLMDSL